MRYRITDKEVNKMHRHHGRCGMMHGLMNDDEELIHMKMRFHGMGPGPMMGRHFITENEKVELIERYKEWLEKELKGVNEHIEKLKKE
jgi:hypothetical protein